MNSSVAELGPALADAAPSVAHLGLRLTAGNEHQRVELAAEFRRVLRRSEVAT